MADLGVLTRYLVSASLHRLAEEPPLRRVKMMLIYSFQEYLVISYFMSDTVSVLGSQLGTKW